MLLCGVLCSALSVSFGAIVQIVLFFLHNSNTLKVQASLPPGAGQFLFHSFYINNNNIQNWQVCCITSKISLNRSINANILQIREMRQIVSNYPRTTTHLRILVIYLICFLFNIIASHVEHRKYSSFHVDTWLTRRRKFVFNVTSFKRCCESFEIGLDDCSFFHRFWLVDLRRYRFCSNIKEINF